MGAGVWRGPRGDLGQGVGGSEPRERAEGAGAMRGGRADGPGVGWGGILGWEALGAEKEAASGKFFRPLRHPLPTLADVAAGPQTARRLIKSLPGQRAPASVRQPIGGLPRVTTMHHKHSHGLESLPVVRAWVVCAGADDGRA